MGTNFYHRTAICEHCGRYDEHHICKSMTSFQGYPDLDVMSWQDWKRRIRAGGEVWNEYGDQIPTEDFIRDVELEDMQERRRQYDWVKAHSLPYDTEDQKTWLDPDGYTFYAGDFS